MGFTIEDLIHGDPFLDNKAPADSCSNNTSTSAPKAPARPFIHAASTMNLTSNPARFSLPSKMSPLITDEGSLPSQSSRGTPRGGRGRGRGRGRGTGTGPKTYSPRT